jgi:hypothetical protein
VPGSKRPVIVRSSLGTIAQQTQWACRAVIGKPISRFAWLDELTAAIQFPML